MKTLFSATLLMATIAHAGWYNVHTAAERNNLPPSLSFDGGILTNPTQADYRAAGWLVLIPFETPFGSVRIDGTRRIDVTDAGAYEVWDVETEAAHEAKRIAAIAAEPMADKPNAPTYGQAVGALVQLLALFNITLPTDPFSVMDPIDSAIDANPKKAGKSQKLMFLYNALKARMSDSDIYAISKLLEGKK